MAGADDRSTAACEPGAVATQYVGQRVRDRVGGVGLAAGRDAGSAQDVRATPGACGVDDGCCGEFFAVGQADQEWSVVAAGGADPIEADPGHGDHLCAVAGSGRELGSLGQWCEVVVDQVAAGRQRVRVGFGPAGAGEQTAGGGVDVVAPGAEQRARAAIPGSRRPTLEPASRTTKSIPRSAR